MNKTCFGAVCAFALVMLSACSGGGGGGGKNQGPTFSVGITVTGLAGSGLVLRNNGSDALPVTANGPNLFGSRLSTGAAYSISISAQPLNPSQTCVISNPSGVVAAADVTGITVTCTTNQFAVTGTVSGLSGAVTVQNNGADDLVLRANGAFSFATPVTSGAAYDVTVLTQPDAPPQRCIAGTTGSGTVLNGPVTSVILECETQYPRVAYSLNAGEGSVGVYNVDSTTGQLRARGLVKTGSSPSQYVMTSDGRRLFVANAVSSNVSAYVRDGVTGELTEVAGSPFTTGANSGSSRSLAVHPGNRFVYVANSDGGNSIAAFSIDATGALSPVAGSPFATGTLPARVLVHSSGRFAYVLNKTSKDIYVYNINAATGALTEVPDSRVASGVDPSSLNLHPNGRWAYVPTAADGSVTAYSIDPATGKLTQIPGGVGAAGVSPQGNIIFHPSGRFLYVTSNSSDSGSVSAFAIAQSTGALTPIAGSPYVTGLSAAAIAMDPAGKLMYVANQGIGGAGSIAMFRIDASTGALVVIGSSISLLPAPTTLNIDPSGKFVYAASSSSNQVYSFSIDATTGALIPLARTAVMRTGDHPIAFATESVRGKAAPAVFASKFVYAANFGDNTISQYSFNAQTGGLTEIGPAFAAGGGPRALAAELGAAELFGTSQTDSALASFDINASSGALSLPRPPLATASAPVAVAMDAGRRFVFVANSQVNTISGYRYDRNTHTLTATGSVLDTGESPLALTVDPTGRVLFFVTNTIIGRAGIDPGTGALTPGAPTPIDAGASAIAVDPTGRFAFVTIGTNPGLIREFAINPYPAPALGALASVGAAGTGGVPRAVAVDPTGRFAYTADSAGYSISAFLINQVTGELTPNGAIAAGATPISLSVDYSGRFVYVTNSTANTVSAFAINTANGTLTAIGAVPTGSSPVAIAIAGEIR